jgi:hypothetical protein
MMKCAHGKPLDEECLACAALDRIEQRRNAEITRLRDALRPFALEGRKWLGTNAAHDDLKLLCGEEWGLMDRQTRSAEFTIGDLKRAVAVLDAGEA